MKKHFCIIMLLKENVCCMKKIYYMIIYIGISNYFQSCIMNYLLEVFIIIINDKTDVKTVGQLVQAEEYVP